MEDVVTEAIRQGFQVFGLSEHVPRYRTSDLYPEEVGETRFIYFTLADVLNRVPRATSRRKIS